MCCNFSLAPRHPITAASFDVAVWLKLTPLWEVVVEEEEDSELCCHPGHHDQEVVVEVLDEGSYHHNLF